jgi:hypothetical protein
MMNENNTFGVELYLDGLCLFAALVRGLFHMVHCEDIFLRPGGTAHSALFFELDCHRLSDGEQS